MEAAVWSGIENANGRAQNTVLPFSLVEEGGDWERRNRLKVYEGYHLLSIRNFKAGGALLLDALSTFTATELISYNEFVTLTVLSNTLSLPRTELKKEVSQMQ